MPFMPVGGKNFEQVLAGIDRFLRPALWLLRLHPRVDGWTFDQHVAALSQMVGDASDKLYASDAGLQLRMFAAEREAAALRADLDGLSLIVSRLQEKLAAISPLG